MKKITSLKNVSFYKVSVPVKSFSDEECVSVQHGRQMGQKYLFSGRVDVFRDCYEEIRIHIWKNTGELVGLVFFGDLKCSNGKNYVDINQGVNIKTVHYLKEEQYFVYVSYNEDYVLLRMDVCPGDEEILNGLLY